MDNRVGDNVPTQAELDALVAQLQDAKDKLAKFAITLMAEERKSRLKPLRGAEAQMRKVVDLCTRYKVSMPAAPVGGMLNDLNLMVQLEPVLAALQPAAQMAEDTQNQAFSEAWQAHLLNYAALSLAAEHDAALAKELQPVIEFMRLYGRRKAPSTTDTPANPAPAPVAPAAQVAPAGEVAKSG